MAKEKSKQKVLIERLKKPLGFTPKEAVENLTDEEIKVLMDVAVRPDITIRANKSTVPHGMTIVSQYGEVRLDGSLNQINSVFINGTRFETEGNDLNTLSKLIGTKDDVKSVVTKAKDGSRRKGIGRKARTRRNKDTPLEELQEVSYQDMLGANITYENLFEELSVLMNGRQVSILDIANELHSNKIPENEIAHFLIYESQYKTDIIGQILGQPLESSIRDYEFEPLDIDANTFVSKLARTLGVEEAEYDEENGVMKVGKRLITNIPSVDENGVFHSRDTRYLPYHIGYYENIKGTRVERLRVIDPVEQAIEKASLEFELTSGDVKFSSILDVTRNLPDFDNHPYGKEILHTLKRKIVLDKSYLDTNSLIAQFKGQTDDLGAVALTMLDDDAECVIDPYGTSNGRNLGVIFYLTEDAEIQADGSIKPGQSRFSKVGNLMNQFHVDKDNFNRNQMSFNALLTSIDVKPLNVYISEFGLLTAEDSCVMTERGAQQFSKGGSLHGDKIQDFHGNKGIHAVSMSELSEDDIKNRKLEHAMEFQKLNPDVDLIISPIAIPSRGNVGVGIEGLLNTGEKKDIILPDGTVTKDGMITLMYASLPQTSDKKSKDYSVDLGERKYSNLYSRGIGSKIGKEMYQKAMMSEEQKQKNITDVAVMFQRQGITFYDESKLIEQGNIKPSVDAPVTVSCDEFVMTNAQTIRDLLMSEMVDGQINIAIGEGFVNNPFTKEPIQDSQGRNVIPIRVAENETIPYRYLSLLNQLALGNVENLDSHFKKVVSSDYDKLSRKDSVLKHIDTVKIQDGARTTVIVADPSVKLSEVRSNSQDDKLVIHRDPVIHSGNVISVNNVGGAKPNVLHVNPLMVSMVDGDFDGDTMGERDYSTLYLKGDEITDFYNKTSVTEQLNQYGDVFAGVDSAHFRALSKACDIDISDLNFDDGKSNEELQDLIDSRIQEMIENPKSYGAYGISFTDEKTMIDSFCKISDDGLKGDTEELRHRFEEGYTREENRAILKALVAKSEWTGLAGATTNTLISNLGEDYDPELLRPALSITHSMTQSVLQMKKNADKLVSIDHDISEMKKVMSGAYDAEVSRTKLKQITQGWVQPEAVDIFVDKVLEKQTGPLFGSGVIHSKDVSTMKLAYASSKQFENIIQDLSETAKKTQGRSGFNVEQIGNL